MVRDGNAALFFMRVSMGFSSELEVETPSSLLVVVETEEVSLRFEYELLSEVTKSRDVSSFLGVLYIPNSFSSSNTISLSS
jgi:hypothetical protein